MFQFGPESGLADSSGNNGMRNRGPYRPPQAPRTPQTPRIDRSKQGPATEMIPRSDSNLNLRAMLEQGADWAKGNPMLAAVAIMLLCFMLLLAQTI